MARFRLAETTAADMPRMFEIWNDPLVLEHQYRPPQGLTPELYARFALTGPRRCTSIFADDQLIGYVSRAYGCGVTGRVCYLSWDLSPAYWGQGIMPAALTTLVDYMFTQDDVRAVVADCFATNQRCLRVLAKVGFQRTRLGLRAMFAHFIWSKGKRRVLRFRLTARQWGERSTLNDCRYQTDARPDGVVALAEIASRRPNQA